MHWLLQTWRAVTTSKRTALLEAENARLTETNAVLEDELLELRKENRALLNTILSQAGVTPLPSVEEEKPKPVSRIRHLTLHQQRRHDEVVRTRTDFTAAAKLHKEVTERIAKGVS